jgi:hypothetical protein
MAGLIGICLILMMCYSQKLARSCSDSNLFAARLSTFIVFLCLTIAFVTLFVMGLLARSKLVLSIGIPVLVAVFFAIIAFAIVKLKKRSDSSNDSSRYNKGNESETEDLNEELKVKDKKKHDRNDLPSYDDVIA